MRAWRSGGCLGPLLGLAVGAAGAIPAAAAFEVYCVQNADATLSCQRLDQAGSDSAMVCVENLSNTRTCTSAEGKEITCVRARGNVFSCATPGEGAPERSHCQFTGRGVYECQKAPKPHPPALPMEGASDGDSDTVEDGETELEGDVMLDGLDD